MKKKAALFVLLGQSNAVGHGIPMEEKDYITTPMTHVFGLDRKDNQSFDNDALVWSGYVSHSMNLAETQDNTYSLANVLASLWQRAIDGGTQLPDLYIVQIAIGAQGVTEGFMWHPDREKKLTPGALGTVDISLFPFTEHILSLIDKSFAERDTEYEVLGVHWRGGCEDVLKSNAYLQENLIPTYTRIFDMIDEKLHHPPFVLHRLVCPDRMHDINPNGEPLANMNYTNEVFEHFVRNADNFTLFDARTYPQFIPNERCNGIFLKDGVHFTPEVNTWICQQIVNDYIKKANL